MCNVSVTIMTISIAVGKQNPNANKPLVFCSDMEWVGFETMYFFAGKEHPRIAVQHRRPPPLVNHDDD